MKYTFIFLIALYVLSGCKPSNQQSKIINNLSDDGKSVKQINWSKDVPAKHDIINGSAITYNDEIYVLTGKEGRLVKYNPVKFTWTDLPGLPGPRTEAGMTLWKDRIVVAGGIDDSSHILRRVDYFDLKEGVWKDMNSLPNSRARLSLDVMNDKLYATCGVCGTTESFYSDCLDILEYKEDSHNWNPVTKLKSGRFSYSSVVVGTGLYILGGFGGAPGGGTFFIDHEKKEYGFKPELPNPRGNFGAVKIGNAIYTFGGRVKGSNSPMEKFDLATNKWETFGICGFWSDRFAYTKWKNYIYVIGGTQEPHSVWKGEIIYN